MDFMAHFNVLVIPLVTIAFVSCLFQALMKYRKVGETKILPPGPWKLPLVGNMHQLVGGLPHHILRDIAGKHGPIMLLQLGEVPLVVVSSARIAKEVLKTRDPIFAGRPQLLAVNIVFYGSKDVLSHTYDEYWRQMRKILGHELLNAKTVRSLAPVRQDVGDNLISLVRKRAGQPLNMTETISQYTMSVVCRSAFGRICKGEDEFVKLVNQVARLASSFDLADLFPSIKVLHFLSGKMPKILQVHKKMDKIMEDIINQHIRNFDSEKQHKGEGGEEDLVYSLLRVKDTNDLKFPITSINIKAIITDVFVGGTETSTTLMIWVLSELMRNSRVMEKAQREIRDAFLVKESIDEAGIFELKYLDLVIKETLRLHPPAPLLFPRESLEDCVIDGYTIPAKTKLMVNAWAIGRDPALWDDPTSFIPERFETNMIDFNGNNFEFIPFGAGKRLCPGIAFGLANTKLPLALLLYHFDWNLIGGLKPEDLDMSENVGATAGRKFDLLLIPTFPSTTADWS